MFQHCTNEEKLIAGMIARTIEQIHYKETIPFGDEILRHGRNSAVKASRRLACG